MKRIFHALRTWVRGNGSIVSRRPIVHRKPRFEILENRLSPATDFRSVIGLGDVQNTYPYRGAGYTVAVLDTGIDYNDTDLGGGFGAGHRVVDGYDFVNNDANPMDDNGHGTHLAGIIGSSNPTSPGIAPNVNFVALKVLDANMNGTWTAIDSALKWVISHKAEYNIVAINLSLGSGNYTSNPYNMLESDFVALKNLGVFTAIASGNNYYTYNSQPGLSYPAISPNVVSVGATWAADAPATTFTTGGYESDPTVDHIVTFTQRSSALDLVAPGAWITSDWLNNTTHVMGGTSMATAVVSGSAVLLHEAYDKTGQGSMATQDNLLKLMQSTGVTIVDANYGTDNVVHTGLSFRRIDLKAAVDAIGQPIAPPTFAVIANQTLPVGGTIVVPLNASSPNGSKMSYTVRQVYLPALAYQLDQQFGLSYLGTYYLNNYGANEKWMLGNNGLWYGVLPDGELRRWVGNMSDTLSPANLIATLDPSYYNDPSKLWSAPYAGVPPVVFSINNNQLSIRSPATWLGTYTVVVTATDGHYTIPQTFTVTEVAAPIVNTPPTLSPIANVNIAHNLDAHIALVGNDANGNALTYSAQVQAVNGQTPPLKFTIAGNQLTIHPTQPITGTFTISATVSDGSATTTKTFSLTLTDAAPTLAAIMAQTVAKGQANLSVTLSASDADNDPLKFSAVAQTPNAAAYQLNQLQAFQPANANYYLNLTGHSEKWLIDKNNNWYALLPNGAIYRWTLTAAQTFTAANLIATLDPSFYNEPRLLWNANPSATPSLLLQFQGNQLIIQRPTTLTGIFLIDVTASDGLLTTKRTIQLTLS